MKPQELMRTLMAITASLILTATGAVSAQQLTVTRLAGNDAGWENGFTDGCAAQVDNPFDIAFDDGDTLYVADTFNRVVRKITTGGVASTLAGAPNVVGDMDGTGSAARFYALQGITVDGSGNVYVADDGVLKIKKITPAGVVSTIVNGVSRPYGVEAASDGTLYFNNGHAIFRRDTNGTVTLVAGDVSATGFVNGNGAAARFNSPAHLALDSAGNLYVVDQTNKAIRKITPSGDVSTFNTYPVGTNGVDVGGDGRIYVSADMIYEYSAAGALLATYGNATANPELGSPYDDGPVSARRISGPLAVNSAGVIHVAMVSLIKRIVGDRITTFAGSKHNLLLDHGPCTARFSVLGEDSFLPNTTTMSVAADRDGQIYVGDYRRISRITRDGAFQEFAVLPGAPPCCSHRPTVATATDSSGNLYLLDTQALYKYTPDGTRTALGEGFSGGAGMTVDPSGNIYITNKVYHFVWKVTQSPVSATVFAGTYSVAGADDGAPGIGKLDQPVGITSDEAGNLYVADTGNALVRKIAPNGTISTIAGTADSFSVVDGNRATARFNDVRYIAHDPTGVLYVTDIASPTATDLIRQVTMAGDVVTVAGQAASPEGYVDGTGTTVRFRQINSLSNDGDGHLYVGDGGNAALRVAFISSSAPQTVTFSSANYSGSESSSSIPLTVQRSSGTGNMTVDVIFSNGTATANEDYVGEPVRVIFFDGETSKIVAVPIFDDERTEGDEAFTATLANQTVGTIGSPGSATVTITEAVSGQVQFAASAYSVTVSADVVVLTVTRTGDTSSTATVNWTTSDLTARAGSDYVASSGTLTFDPGETSETISIIIPDDRIPESRERFLVTLSAPGGVTLGAPSTATVTIIDDDVFPNTYHDGLIATAHADFNGDGKSDVLWRNETTGYNLIWTMDGTTVAGGSAFFIVDPSFRVAGVADFNDDGKADIVWYDGNAGITDIWLMNGSTRIGGSAYATMILPWEIAGLGDFNADGDADILWRNGNTGQNLIWYLQGTTVVGGSAFFTVDTSFWLQAIDDFDNDGYADLVWQNHAGVIDVWLMQGSVMVEHATYGFGGSWFAVAVNDFNGDGTPDILLRNLASGQNLIWYMNGAQVAGGSANFTVDPNFRLELTGDFNGDGKGDLAWRRTVGYPTIDFWLMNGHVLLGSRAYDSFDGNWRAVAPR